MSPSISDCLARALSCPPAPCPAPAPNAPTCTPHTPMTPWALTCHLEHTPSNTPPKSPSVPTLAHPRAKSPNSLTCTTVHYLSHYYHSPCPLPRHRSRQQRRRLVSSSPETTQQPNTHSLHYSDSIHYRMCQHVNPYWPRPVWSVCLISTNINNP